MVLPAATPRYSAQYGTFTLDETNGIRITSEPDSCDSSIDGSYYLEFEVRLVTQTSNSATDDASFAALVEAAEAALGIPRQRFLAKLGTQTLRDWDWSGGTQTAIMILPELSLKWTNARIAHYGFRVRCQFPGRVPNNAFRRESLSAFGSSLRERRTCTCRAQWTSSTGVTAYERYTGSGNAFFNGILPANDTDQYGTVGTWMQLSEDPPFNDENSIIDVTRVYIEIFAGRRDSSAKTLTTIGNQRVFVCPSVWTGDGTNNALQNYTDGGDGYYDSALPTPLDGGAWVLVDEEPELNDLASDADGILTVTRTYHECFAGLREYTVEVTTNAAQLRKVVIRGTYYDDGTDAKTNYTSGIGTLVTAVLAAESPAITHYNTHSIPKITGYDQNNPSRYFFVHTILELAYPQSLSGAMADNWADGNVVFETLDVAFDRPWEPESYTDAIDSIDRQTTGSAQFVALIDITSSGGDDPATLWDTSSGLRDFVLAAIIAKLGPAVTTVDITDEKVNVGLDRNMLVGHLEFTVTGQNIISLQISQTLTQVPSRDFAAQADGTLFSAYPYRDSAEKLLHREATVEYVIGSAAPAIFAVGDMTVSGFAYIDTGITAADSIAAQNATGTMTIPDGGGWFIDRRSPAPQAVTTLATTRGKTGGLATVKQRIIEDWRWLVTLLPGISLS